MISVALSIAGSDPGGGAGIQADLKTFHQFGVYGTAVIALLTVQNTRGVSRVVAVDPDVVAQQIDAVLADISPGAIKTGALGTANVVEAVASRMSGFRLVVDPVTMSSSGMALAGSGVVDALRSVLLPMAELVTPNLAEAAGLAGVVVVDTEGMREAARRIAGLGAKSVLVKGGHLEGDAVDILWHDGEFAEFRSARVETGQTHGTGCTLSAAITACMAMGWAVPEAVGAAKQYVTEALRTAPGLGGGTGPLNHWAAPGKKPAFDIIGVPDMTKVQKQFRLQRPLDEALMQQIANANSIYGIETIRIGASREELLVEYDASRLRTPDVESALQRAGIPVVEVVNP